MARNMFTVTGASGYDATRPKNKRSAPTGLLRSEDAELRPMDRRLVLSATRDLQRNFSLAAWMVRRHLDYVSTFNFQPRCVDPAHNESLTKLMRWWSLPANCDITGRFSLSKQVRLWEMRRTIDGDVFPLKLRDGRIQTIEGDRIRTPLGGAPLEAINVNVTDLNHGVLTNEAGKPLRYCICKRAKVTDTSGGLTNFAFERMVDAQNLYHFGYFDRFDQVRGISPLAAAINTLRDCYEGFDYALAKMKVSQLFGLSVYRAKSDPLGNPLSTQPEASEDGDDDQSGYEVDFGRGPVFLDMDPGDRAEFLESHSPSSEFQQFSQTMVSVALKALDIPYSFYAENFTNYSGSRQALLQYELAAQIKRDDVQALLNHLTAWRISLWVQDGVLDADLSDIEWEWIPKGIGWIDPLKEIQANIAAIGAGLESRTQILQETTGRSFVDVVNELKAENAMLIDAGLAATMPAPIPITEVVSAAA